MFEFGAMDSDILVLVFSFLLFATILLFVYFLPTDSHPRGSPDSHSYITDHSILDIDRSNTEPQDGLDRSVIQALPITIHRREDYGDGMECAVCLSGLLYGEDVRLLPKCLHCFHIKCIDAWFCSHSTCPLCRSSIADQLAEQEAVAGNSMVSHDLLTKVLLWRSVAAIAAAAAASAQERSLADGGTLNPQ